MGNPYAQPVLAPDVTPPPEPGAIANPYDTLPKELPSTFKSGRREHAPLTLGETVADVGKNIPAGLAEGTAGLAGFWGSTRKFLADTGESFLKDSLEKAGLPPDKIEEVKKHYQTSLAAHDKRFMTSMPTTADIEAKINQAQPLYQSQSDVGDIARSVAAQVPQAAIGPVRSVGGYLAGTALRAGLPGTASEVTHKVLEGSSIEPVASGAAAIAGAGVARGLYLSENGKFGSGGNGATRRRGGGVGLPSGFS